MHSSINVKSQQHTLKSLLIHLKKDIYIFILDISTKALDVLLKILFEFILVEDGFDFFMRK
jgi:hypothetical protein